MRPLISAAIDATSSSLNNRFVGVEDAEGIGCIKRRRMSAVLT
jgi:hypothetical protein